MIELSKEYIRYEVIDLLYKELPGEITLEEFEIIVEQILNLIDKICGEKRK